MAWIASGKTGPRASFDPRRDDSRGAEIRGVDDSSNASGLGESGKGVEASRAVCKIGTQRAKTPVNVPRARDIYHGLHPQTTGTVKSRPRSRGSKSGLSTTRPLRQVVPRIVHARPGVSATTRARDCGSFSASQRQKIWMLLLRAPKPIARTAVVPEHGRTNRCAVAVNQPRANYNSSDAVGCDVASLDAACRKRSLAGAADGPPCGLRIHFRPRLSWSRYGGTA